MNDQTVPLEGTEAPRKGPTYGHFYLLLVLLLLVLGGAVAMFLTLRNSDEGIGQELGNVSASLTSAQDRQAQQLGAQLTELDGVLAKTRQELATLQQQVGSLRGEFVEYKTAADAHIADLNKGLAEQEMRLTGKVTELADKLEVARAELAKEQETTHTVVAQLQDDSKYIISELGKKAEKAYLRFMERKLKKKITAVSDEVKTVKSDLETRITETRTEFQTELEKVTGEVGETIKKKVEEHVKIDFVPSATDEE